jgi:NAD(P)-dependent dehydrogenase (short-subunit alcohol dehydrogenase family)
MSRPTALVTGASRGIGKAVAVALARDGFDVAITARTVHEGTGVNPNTGQAIEGSLDTTAALIADHGGRAVPVVLDLLRLETIPDAWEQAVAGLGGRVDVVVNNAIYAGPGNECRFGDVDPADVVKRVTGNLTAQLLLTRVAVRHMLGSEPRHGRRGTFLNITSHAGQATPTAPAGHGGWALTYAATKAGFHRIADMLAVEYGDEGIVAVNINPGFVATERVLSTEALAFVASRGIPPAPIGEAVVRILHDHSIANGSYVHAPNFIDPG